MKKYRTFSFLLLIPIILSMLCVPSFALEEPELQCRNAVLVDANYGEVLYSKGAYDKAYPASITKVMTALLVMEALESGQLTTDTVVTVSELAAQKSYANESSADLKAGEQLTVEELLYCLLLPSANDAAKVLAEAVDGSIEEFVAHMNRKAGELGCQGTHFVNPHGLHDDDHYTTAYDISLFMTAALEYDLFRTIIGTASHTVPATNLSGERLYYNTNGLISNLHYLGYVYDKCIGGKTGSTDEAGRCLVAAAEDGDTLLVSVVLGSGPIEQQGYDKLRQGQFTESTKLLKWGFQNFERVTITRGSEPVDKVAVTLSRQADEVNVKPQGSITRTLPKDLDLDKIETEITLFSPEVEAPVQEGQVLGTMKLSYEGEVYGTLDLVAVTSVERSELLYKKAQFIAFFQSTRVKLVLVLVLLVVVLLVLKLTVFRKRRRYHSGAGARARGNYRGTRRR
ncbi:MAG: D-alanyl-D-alanine carboxypeptidase family protein [Lawsonibacter sp.]|nr:D-alanyl-D-alanine carboxypeptidase family protein [Lawsonibacter sp.]